MSTASFCHFGLCADRVTTSKRDRKKREAVIKLDRLTSTEHSAPWASDLLFGFLTQPNTEVRLAYTRLPDGEKDHIGWIAFRWNEKWNLEVHHIAVHPDYRKRGIGRWLVDCATATAHENIFAEVQERDLRTQLFLRACGFKCTHIMERLEEDGGDAYLFTKIKS